ncbi:DNA internalization-related competence protein ComEC/Rec2 [Cupriavidus basilensis]|uniref:DNA internalization-related competence protein ComEC/Rec2 n=1 Tax=Cupriavidus basilensis TaxID=68895 RepID=A0A0C4Y6P1_9BURK|nr:DNA internalization-related competence protein ComEC/Rec2 [Cupriavidus basilensis]AJG18670.1 DNA internalization-related competence protein ComEC/Rec2 [Cupriavidus basilensis]
MRLFLLAFVAGCWWLQQQGSLPRGGAVWVLAAAGLLAAALALCLRTRWPGWARVAWIVLSLLAGFGCSAWRAEVRLAQRLAPGLEGVDLQLSGVVAGLPAQAARGLRFVFALDDAAAMPPRVLLGWEDAPASLRPGERYVFTVRLRQPHGLANPHGFDYEFWLMAAGLGATGYVRDAIGEPQDAVGERLAWRIARWRAQVRDHVLQSLPPDARFAPVLAALVVGDQHGIQQRDWTVFTRTGIGHLISISGLHITMISGLFSSIVYWLWRHSFGLGRWLPRPLPLWWPARRAALVGAVIAALVYGLLAGMQVPALRTVSMLVVAALALWSGRTPPASLVLAWAAFVAIGLDPWAVLSPGFWLSFGAVGVIFLAAAQPANQSAPTRWQRVRASLAQAARTQWCVTIGLVPLTLLLFQQVSVISPLANAAAIPLISLLVTPMALLAAAMPAPLAGWLLSPAHLLLHWLVLGLEWLSALPWAVWQAARAGPVALALAVLGSLLLLAPVPCGVRARLHGVVLLLPMVLAGRQPVAHGEFRATAIDIGQGTAVLVETRSRVLLYDAGPAYGWGAARGEPGNSAGARDIVPFLRSAGVRRLDTLVISHEDADHAGGARDIMAALPVDSLLSGAPQGHRLLVPPASAAHLEAQPCEAGQQWEWDGVRFAMLHPLPGNAQNAAINSNARSCVLKVAGSARSLLLTGDIGRRDEAALLARLSTQDLRADFLQVPHHGSNTSSSGAFLAVVAPEVALFQVGYRNRHRHPRPEIWGRYGSHEIARYRSDETGAVQLTTRGESYALQAYRQHARRYWRAAPPAPR